MKYIKWLFTNKSVRKEKLIKSVKTVIIEFDKFHEILRDRCVARQKAYYEISYEEFNALKEKVHNMRWPNQDYSEE